MSRSRLYNIGLLILAVIAGVTIYYLRYARDNDDGRTIKVGLIPGNAWVRATIPGSDTTGAFMVIENRGTQPQRLIAAEVDPAIAEKAEIHEMTMGANDVMQMRPVEGIDIAPESLIELKPGGYHIMLLGVKRDLKPGDSIVITLHFEMNQMIQVRADVREMTE